MEKPLLIFDGDCGFCRRWIQRWKRSALDRFEIAPYQEVAAQYPQISAEDFRSSIHLLEPDGKHYRGAEAVFRCLSYNPRRAGWLWLYRHFPGFAVCSEWCYRRVAAHRVFFSFWTRALWGKDLGPYTYFQTRRIFFVALGVVYFAAFA